MDTIKERAPAVAGTLYYEMVEGAV